MRFYTEGGKPLPYDPWTAHPIPVADLEACAKKQGVSFREGDILLLRVGFTKKWNESSLDALDALSKREETL